MKLQLARRLFAVGGPLGRFRLGSKPAGKNDSELARRIEERAYLTSLEAQAYVDQKIDALKAPSLIGEYIERRALLASQEAKAYSDSAIESLGGAVRGMSKAVLRLSRRVETLEESNLGLRRLNERMEAVERGLSVLQDNKLARRGDQLASEINEFSGRFEDCLNHEARLYLHRVERGIQDLAADIEELERAFCSTDNTTSGAPEETKWQQSK